MQILTVLYAQAFSNDIQMVRKWILYNNLNDEKLDKIGHGHTPGSEFALREIID